MLEDYIEQPIEHLWQQGDPKTWVADLPSAFGHFLPNPCAGRRRGAWRLYAGWGRIELPTRALPHLWEQTCSISVLITQWSYMRAAIMGFLGFDCCLRTEEMSELRMSDVHVGESKAVIGLQQSKTGQRNAGYEGVVVHDPRLCRLLRSLKCILLPGDHLLDTTVGAVRSVFRRAMAALDFHSPRYQLYSLRRGGATFFFQVGNSLRVSQLRYRHANSKTSRSYSRIIGSSRQHEPNASFETADEAVDYTFRPKVVAFVRAID